VFVMGMYMLLALPACLPAWRVLLSGGRAFGKEDEGFAAWRGKRRKAGSLLATSSS
jgi:hypothetical protein